MAAWRNGSAAVRSRTHNLGWVSGRNGNVALLFALILPVLLTTGLGAVQLNQVMSDKRRTQDVADSAALMGASQIAVTAGGVDQRTQSYAQAQLADVAAGASVTVQATAGKDGTMSVAIDTHRVSFFGNLLPPGGSTPT